MWNARNTGALDNMIALAEQCLRDYDEDGWCGPTWLNPDDAPVSGADGTKHAAE